MAQQMTTTEQMFEEAKEDLNRPAVVIHQSDDFGRNVDQIRRNAKEAVAVLAC